MCRVLEAGVRPSMGTVGDCYDNAMCESILRDAGMRVDRAPALRDPDSRLRMMLRRSIDARRGESHQTLRARPEETGWCALATPCGMGPFRPAA